MDEDGNLHDRIQIAWDWCAEAYLRNGVKISFPKYTDRTKTYQWRYLTKLVQKFDEWKFDAQTSIRFIETAVKKSTKENLHRKGLSVLLQGNLPEICYKEIKEELERYSQSIRSLKITNDILISRFGDKPYESLITRTDDLPMIVRLYNNNTISDLYISLSKSCWKAVGKLHSEFDGLLPNFARLYLVRSEFIGDTNNVQQAKAILLNDWREAWPLR